MCKWIKRLFAKNVDVVVNKNFVTCSGYTSNGKVKVGDTFIGEVTPLENYTIDFVTVYRNKISFFNEIKNCVTYKMSENGIITKAFIDYTAVKGDEAIIICANGIKIGSPEIDKFYITNPIYEMRCDVFQYHFLKGGGYIVIEPYVLVTENDEYGRRESVIRYSDRPDYFHIEISGEPIDNGYWILNRNTLSAKYNDSGHPLEGEITVKYEDNVCIRASETNQIYQES